MKKNILSIAAFLGLASSIAAQEVIVTSPTNNGGTFSFIKPDASQPVTSTVTFSAQEYLAAIDGNVTRLICTANFTLGGTVTNISKGANIAIAGGTNGLSQGSLIVTAGNGVTNGQTFALTINVTERATGGQSCTSKAAFTASGTVNFVISGPLAVELTSFEGKTDGNKVNLAWSTASEKDNATFEIERSYDAINFTTVGIVKGNGTTNEAHNYAYTDATATGRIAYYRLKDIDVAGQVSYSQIVGVKLGKGSKLEVSTIATELGLVTFNAMEEGNATLNVVNLAGQVVAQAQATATEGNNVVPMNLNALANGIYLLQVRTANSTVTKKFVKN